MRMMFSLVGLLIVLAIVAINVRNELHANKALLPAPAGASASSDSSSAPFGGSSSPSVAQFQQELDKTMRNAAARRDAADSDAESR